MDTLPPPTKKKERIVHPSHKMTEWRWTIISTGNSDRFGNLRECTKCEGEQAKTVTGTHTHSILWRVCPLSEEGIRDARIKRAAPELLIACRFLRDQVKQLAHYAFSDGVEEWLEKCDALNCANRAIEKAEG
jgi:hypothetical protein